MELERSGSSGLGGSRKAKSIQNLPTSGGASNLDLPELPTVPSDTPTHSATGSLDEKKNNDEDEDIDFDDLTRRFEALKKKK